VDVGPGIPLPAPPPTTPHSELRTPHSKRGRPLVFDEVKRAEFIGMLKAGFTIRYAARRVGVSHAAVLQARDRDPLFGAQIVKAQMDRDLHCVRRIHNAGKKSWRAAAWLLERVEPKEFSLKHKNRDPSTVRSQNQLKKLINEIVDSRLADRPKSNKRDASVNRALQLIEDRLAEIESQCDPYVDSDDEELDRDATDPGERGGVSPPITHDDLDDVESDEDEPSGDESDDDEEPDEDFEENNGYESEQAAVEAYRQALRKLNVPHLDISEELDRWSQYLRKQNDFLRARRQPG
jgi:hypothetical protein